MPVKGAPNTRGLVPVAAALRGSGGPPETLHLGAIAVVDGAGEPVWSAGDPRLAYPLRSTAKPVQLLPYLLDGLDRRNGTDAADLAVMMASHSGEPEHVARVGALLDRFGLAPDQLQCGTHPPYHEETRVRLAAGGEVPSVLHCNCSGKHAAMLAVCAANGWPLESYLAPEHPLQRRIEALLRVMADASDAPLPRSVDGCALPTWWLPLAGLAQTFARLADGRGAPALEDREPGPLLGRLYDAATAHPHMLAGSGRLDTDLMRRLGTRVFTKTGADGLYAMAVRPTRRHPRGLGIAFKVADGDPASQVRALVASRLLAQLDPDALSDALSVDDGERRNNRGQVVGERVVLFRVES